MTFRTGLLYLVVALVVAFSAAPATAQTLYGSITGTVTDPSGAAVPNARVEAMNVGTSIVKSAQTDERGSFLFNDLQVGTYKITVSAPSFGTRVTEGVQVAQNTTLRLDSSLSVSQVQETIMVSAAAVSLQTDRSDLNYVIRSNQITDLPIMNSQGRNFQALYKIVPGFTPPVEVHSDSGNPQRSMATQANGMNQSNNNTRLDGATVSYPWLPRIVAYVPPVEAVETVNIVTNSFDAEQGMAGGAAMNVSLKSGTNSFHGGGWIFHNNSAFKARNYFYCLYSCTGDPDRAPKDLQNQFGGMIGGPIVKNKLFFFSDWERTTRRRAVTALRTVPTAAMRGGDFSGTGATLYDPTTGNANGTGRTPFPETSFQRGESTLPRHTC